MNAIKFYFWLIVIAVIAFLIWKNYFTDKVQSVETQVKDFFVNH
jgi:hypothetical protein